MQFRRGFFARAKPAASPALGAGLSEAEENARLAMTLSDFVKALGP
jgi:hypothetical protein